MENAEILERTIIATAVLGRCTQTINAQNGIYSSGSKFLTGVVRHAKNFLFSSDCHLSWVVDLCFETLNTQSKLKNRMRGTVGHEWTKVV